MAKRPMTATWPKRVTVLASGTPPRSRVIDTDSGDEVENAASATIRINSEGLTKVRIVAIDLINHLRFRRDFVVSPFVTFDVPCEADGEKPEIIGVA